MGPGWITEQSLIYSQLCSRVFPIIAHCHPVLHTINVKTNYRPERIWPEIYLISINIHV